MAPRGLPSVGSKELKDAWLASQLAAHLTADLAGSRHQQLHRQFVQIFLGMQPLGMKVISGSIFSIFSVLQKRDADFSSLWVSRKGTARTTTPFTLRNDQGSRIADARRGDWMQILGSLHRYCCPCFKVLGHLWSHGTEVVLFICFDMLPSPIVFIVRKTYRMY
jgi:hypothetical protein